MPQRPKYTLPDTSSPLEIGKKISSYRKKKGLSQTELAKLVGITQALISHYETGRLSIPVEILKQIASVLKVSSDVLIGLSFDKAADEEVPSRKILQRLKLIEKLPAFDQKSLLKTIDNALKGAGTNSSDLETPL